MVQSPTVCSIGDALEALMSDTAAISSTPFPIDDKPGDDSSMELPGYLTAPSPESHLEHEENATSFSLKELLLNGTLSE